MEQTTTEIPEKLFYKAAEVCQITDTQPYVLRFWESEFPQLASEKNRSGQRVYRRADIDLVFRIKKLLYQEEYTIAGARKAIDDDRHDDRRAHPRSKARSAPRPRRRRDHRPSRPQAAEAPRAVLAVRRSAPRVAGSTKDPAGRRKQLATATCTKKRCRR